MRDALYVYAKLNPGVGYVQGMHEMFGCLYYVFATSMKDESNTRAAARTRFIVSRRFSVSFETSSSWSWTPRIKACERI